MLEAEIDFARGFHKPRSQHALDEKRVYSLLL
jgi:hypothetical protein